MSTIRSQPCRGDEHLTTGAAEASSSAAGVRVCACRQARLGPPGCCRWQNPDGIYDAAPAARLEPGTQALQARSRNVLPSPPHRPCLLARQGSLPRATGQDRYRAGGNGGLGCCWLFQVHRILGPLYGLHYIHLPYALQGRVETWHRTYSHYSGPGRQSDIANRLFWTWLHACSAQHPRARTHNLKTTTDGLGWASTSFPSPSLRTSCPLTSPHRGATNSHQRLNPRKCDPLLADDPALLRILIHNSVHEPGSLTWPALDRTGVRRVWPQSLPELHHQ